jgi:16S rRNA (uracil1498-N3)-methyltransferase
MSLPFFYKEDINASVKEILLDEDTSKHVVQVLRMQNGEQLQLTDGKGILFTAEITDNNRKRCSVTILQTTNHQPPTTNITIAISLIKNNNRFEWFLEKATEIGVTTVIPLVCERTEKQHFRHDRMNAILISAMLQSQQCWLPVLTAPIRFEDLIKNKFEDLKMGQFENEERYIAHCDDRDDKQSLHLQIFKSSNRIIFIGPEGDFTKQEIETALAHHFIPVSLGPTRLRTETAGVVAAVLLTQL